MIYDVVAAVFVGIILGKMIEYLFEVRVNQFRKAVADWAGIKYSPSNGGKK